MASSSVMLEDGSNPEGTDPDPPVNWSSKDDLTDVVVYGHISSPPMTKVRYHLAFAGVKYECVERNGRKQPKGFYKKIPSIKVNNRVVNDSYIIVKNLFPALYPNEKDVALEWEEKITYGLQLAMEIEAMEDPASQADLLVLVGIPKILSTVCGCILPVGGPNRTIPKMIKNSRKKVDEKYGPLKTLHDYLRDIKNEIGDGKQSFFGSATSAGAVDVSVFATLKTYYSLPYVENAVNEANLSIWWNLMENVMPESVSQDKFN
mmetsp:Transcript_43723/g.51199  ORF Transcript_43723/g.51199 Transcript_43723/m.51199 type:complete len:262 (-) Transcript_43723:404-1189(-)